VSEWKLERVIGQKKNFLNFNKSYKMKEQIDGVRAFMKLAGQPISDKPTLISKSRSELRYNLGKEELDEYSTACEENDLVEVADALGDQLYILLGTFLEHGLQEHAEGIFKEIQNSNMSKFHETEVEANATLMYHEKNGVKCITEKVEEIFVVKNRDGKVMKNISYKRVNLQPILDGDQFGFSANEIKKACNEESDPPFPKQNVDSIENHSDAITSSDYKGAIFLGIQGVEENKEALIKLNEAFPDKHIFIMNKDIYNQNCELFIKQQINWKEAESIREYTSKPENVQQTMATALLVVEHVGSVWFGKKNLVDNTNMTYKQASEILDLLFAFGFIAKKKNDLGLEVWKIVLDTEGKIEYLQSLIDGATSDIEEFNGSIDYLKNQEESKSK